MMETTSTAEVTAKEKLHNLRTEIDANINFAGDLKADKRKGYQPFKREIALVYTKLQEAKMWAGKCLEAIGSELPKEFQDKAETK